MAKYLKNIIDPAATPQSEPLPGREREMAKNSAGGYSFSLSALDQLKRFVILGTEGGTYYAKERDLTKTNLQAIIAAGREDPRAAIQAIVDISRAGRAPKQSPGIFALAVLASQKDNDRVRQLALQAVPDVCRTSSTLFEFISYATKMRGWGRGLRNAVNAYYQGKLESKYGFKGVAYDLIKYQNRNEWAQRDVLRSAHTKIAELHPLFKYVTKGEYSNALDGTVIQGYEMAKKEATGRGTAKLINQFGLTREMVPSERLNDPEVWAALVDAPMPLTALIRNLNKMTAVGLLAPHSEYTRKVAARLEDRDQLKRARIHPLGVLSAHLVYDTGQGLKGNLTWTPVRQIVDSLEDAFYLAFDAVEPTNQRFMVSVDVSSSMRAGVVGGVPGLTPNMAAACLAMVTIRTEKTAIVNGFSTSLVDLGISRQDRLQDAMNKTQRHFGGTDASLPMLHAIKDKIPVDAFMVLTDNETWAGGVHPSIALKNYRQAMGIDSKFIEIAMTSTGFSIADPKDPGMLDVVGFDSAVPTLLSEFVAPGAVTASSQEEEEVVEST